jgi:hypothetical protein
MPDRKRDCRSTTRRKARLAVAILAMVAISACDGANQESAAAGGSNRAVRATTWDTLWTVGGEQDSLLLMPGPMASTARHVYVADLASSRLVALDPADGSVAWIVGRMGAGPGEFRDPRGLAATPDGGAVVADIRNARLTFVSPDGRVTRELAFPGVGYISSMCALADGSLLLATMEPGRPLVHMAPDGSVRGRHPLPWPDLRDAHPLATTARLATAPDHRSCVLALTRGRGFATFRDGAFRTFAYREAFELPEVEVTREGTSVSSAITSARIAASDVDVVGDTVFVTFAGESDWAGRLVDVYTLPGGEYRFSHRYPAPIHQTSRSGDTFLLLHEAAGYPSLVAARANGGGM